MEAREFALQVIAEVKQKGAYANLVLANDTLTRHNLLVHNEGGTTDYICHKSANRAAIIRLLAEEVMQHLGVSEDV